MNLDLIKEEWKEEFKKHSVDVSDFDQVFKWVYKKGFYRYSVFIAEIRNEIDKLSDKGDVKAIRLNGKLNMTTLNKLYVADLLIRREAFRVIAPIEINIRAAILGEVYSVTSRDLAIDRFNCLVSELRNSEHWQHLSEDKKRKQDKKINKVISHIHEYYANKYFDYFIDNVEIGKLVPIFQILHNCGYSLSTWFDGQITDDVVKSLDKIVHIRNAVMHHNIFMRNVMTQQMSPREIVKDLFETLYGVFGQDNKAIRSFKKNWYQNYVDHELIDVKEYLELFYKCQLFDPNEEFINE